MPNNEAQQAIIYGMCAPPMYPQIRYVGVTKRSLPDRLKCHLYRARKGEATHKGAWIRKVLSSGLSVQMVEIERCPISQWQERERYWVAKLPDLTNSVDGGRGVLNPTPEARERMSIAHRGKPALDHVREFNRERMRGNKYSLGHRQTAEHIARSVAGRIGKVGIYERTPEICKKISEAKKGNTYKRGKRCSLESRMRMSKAQTGLIRGPHSEETKRKISESQRGKFVSRETRLRQSMAKRAYWARRKITGDLFA